MKIIDLIRNSLNHFPSSLALIHSSGNFTYSELYERSAQIANQLKNERASYTYIDGGGSLDDYLTIIACWINGIPYIPLNPKFSEERIKHITHAVSAHKFENSEELAYIMFTSGTTGVPKGVPITQAQVARHAISLNRLVQLSPQDRIMQSCDLSFDVSVIQMTIAWINGACLCPIAPDKVLFSPKYVNDLGITFWSSVPSVVSMSANAGLIKQNSMPSLRYAHFCGEALTYETSKIIRNSSANCQVINTYGPTECTISVSTFIPDKTFFEQSHYADTYKVLPLGTPDTEVELAVFDLVNNEPCNTLGELCIGGNQLTTGYLNRPDLNEEKFFHHNNIRFYRTGDLCVYVPQIGFIYKGRKDRQIKFKGYRIELQDIEAAIQFVIKSDLCSVAPFPITSDGIIEGLVAVIDSNHEKKLSLNKFKDDLGTILPKYMIPNKILFMDQIPLNVNGKIDHNKIATFVSNFYKF